MTAFDSDALHRKYRVEVATRRKTERRDAEKKLSAVTAQRDALLAALRELEEALRDQDHFHLADKCRAAIAQVEDDANAKH